MAQAGERSGERSGERLSSLGPYRVTQLIGRGSVGEVYAATGPLSPSDVVAIKALNDERSAEAIAEHVEQVEQIARIQHPAIHPVYAVDAADWQRFIVMAHATGPTLGQRLRANGASPLLTPAHAVQIVNQLLGAMTLAHAAGVTHGDLHLDNLFTGHSATGAAAITIADFGQSSAPVPLDNQVAADDTVMRQRLVCLAPERRRGPGSPASDQYSLAVIAHLLLAGALPTMPSGEIAAPSTQATLPLDVRQALARALAPEPADRFPDMKAFAFALMVALEHFQASDEPSRTLAAESTAAAATAAAHSDGEQQPSAVSAGQIVTDGAQSKHPTPSYAVTGIVIWDGMWGLVDRLTGGKAAALQKLFTYVLAGVLSAGINLACFQGLYAVALASYPSPWRYLAAYLGAAEVSVMSNFLLNDRYTFQNMEGHARPWPVRCLRFHSTAASGLVVTLLLSLLMHYVFNLTPVFAQAMAILVSLIFNLTMHHIWTYRPVRRKPSQAAEITSEAVGR